MSLHRAILILVALWCVGVVLSGEASGEQPTAEGLASNYKAPKGYICFRATSGADSISIDGKLDEPAWRAAPWTDGFVDIEGNLKPAPRFRTRAKMLWDDNFFYVAAELEEPHLQGTFTKHDSYIFHEDNDFEVFIDPDGDGHNYAEYEMNARNTGWDLRLTKPYKNGGTAEDRWEIPGLKSAVQLNGTLNKPDDVDHGWTIELAFPWSVLRDLIEQREANSAENEIQNRKLAAAGMSPKDGDQWRVNFSRVEWRYEVVQGEYKKVSGGKEDNWVWSPQWTINMHRPETWGYVQFSSAASGSPAAASVQFHPDVAGPAKYLLHRIQYAQVDFQKRHNRWATSLEELELVGLTHPSLRSAPSIQVSKDHFQASVEVKLSERESATWLIREDAKIWRKR